MCLIVAKLKRKDIKILADFRIVTLVEILLFHSISKIFSGFDFNDIENVLSTIQK